MGVLGYRSWGHRELADDPSCLDRGESKIYAGRFCPFTDYIVSSRLNDRRSDLCHCVHVRNRVRMSNRILAR